MKIKYKYMFLSKSKAVPFLSLKIVFVFLLSIITRATADVIFLKGNKNIFGQVMAITKNDIILEVISPEDFALEIETFPLNPVEKVIDESGTVLYENKQAKFADLNPYYSLMENNWEELKFKTLDSEQHVITYRSSEKKTARIISITEQYIFTQRRNPDSTDLTVEKIPVKNILAINNVRVIHTNFNIAKRILLSPDTKYPLYQVQIGYDYVQSYYSEVQLLFQDFFDGNSIDKKAKKRLDGYPGIFMKFEMYLQPYLSLGLSLQYYKEEKINALALTMVDVKYVYRTSLFHPWLSLGFAGQQLSSSETVADITYDWHNSESTIALGAGLNSGKELGIGFNFSVYYMPFGRGKTKINVVDLQSTSSREIDFSLIKISFGMHYSFN
jgi:hypothetical protein